ncbi:MAG: protein-tyrosine-phosphatase [Flavobacteriaceae bacterium]|nr:protein-tyrosine-phosphatase [Flavobacteriaceae bacterium]
MVCLGNICRSPIAEGILTKYLPKSLFKVDSAGISSLHHGEKPDLRSIDITKKNKIDISSQKSRQFNVKDFENFDHIYVMDNTNLKDILSLSTNPKNYSKVKLLIKNKDVPDPYYGGIKEFKDCYDLIDKACVKIANKLLKND